MEPPDPFSNSEVKHRCANGSVVRPCESRSSSAPYTLKAPIQFEWGLFPLPGFFMFPLMVNILLQIKYSAYFIIMLK